MKKLWVILVFSLLLCGCSAEETFETVEDVYMEEQWGPKNIEVAIPLNAKKTQLTSGEGSLYFCDGYELTTEIMAAGNLSETFGVLTGFPLDSLTLVETMQTDMARYECVWTAAGEGGDNVGRAVVLDDGNYHYCVTVMAQSSKAYDLQQTWKDLLGSIQII